MRSHSAALADRFVVILTQSYIQQTAGHTYKCTKCGLINAIKRQSPAPSCVHHLCLDRMCISIKTEVSENPKSNNFEIII